jgi:hypothetical protein
MTIYAISGFPGAGKTTLRTTDPKFTNLPQLDVADFYRKHPGIHSHDAFVLLSMDAGLPVWRAKHLERFLVERDSRMHRGSFRQHFVSKCFAATRGGLCMAYARVGTGARHIGLNGGQ